MHQLEKIFAERISNGLKRRSVVKCSKWAETYRVMPGSVSWSFNHYPWSKEIHDSDDETVVCQKGAQLGVTEYALNRTFFTIDVKGVDCLYVLPAKTPDAKDFSVGRFDAALELSHHLSSLFSDVKNVGHKRAGSVNLYIRGSRSKSGLKSVPVGLIILDEVDEHTKDHIELAFERTSGQEEKQKILISTPTIENHGINIYFKQSSQDHFMFRCPCCGRYTELLFPECLEIATDNYLDSENLKKSHLKCKECKNRLIHETKHEWLSHNKWVTSFLNREFRGFYINQLYSYTISPGDLARHYLLSLNDPTAEQEFYNSKLGLPHVVKGASVVDSDIEACTKNYKKPDRVEQYKLVTMGVDIGTYLHYEIDEWYVPNNVPNTIDLNLICNAKLLAEGKVIDFEELEEFMYRYKIAFAVLDANPEYRKAYEFATKFYGKVRLCYYVHHVQGKQLNTGKDDEKQTALHEPIVSVNRTSWLDMSLSRFKNRTIELPLDLSQEYKAHIKAPVRRYEKDKITGKPVGRYQNIGPDHLAHARNYSEIALPFAASLNMSENIYE